MPTTPQPRRPIEFRADRTLRWTASIEPQLIDVGPSDHPDLFGSLERSRRRFVVIDETVNELYGDRILALLARYGIQHNDPLTIPGGEASKTQRTIKRICAAMDEWGVERFGDEVLIWGGGSILDTAGEAANRYRRCITRRNYGTTLVAVIDAMFALKTAVNEGYKNRVGSYHPPAAAYDVTQCFETLPHDNVLDGVGEIFKVGVMLDGEVFQLLEEHGPRLIAERFQGQDPARASYGGHGISPGMEPDVPHGIAVVLDLLCTTMIFRSRGLLDPSHAERIVALARALGLPLWHPVLEQPNRLIHALADTARHRRGEHLIPAPVSRAGDDEYHPGDIPVSEQHHR